MEISVEVMCLWKTGKVAGNPLHVKQSTFAVASPLSILCHVASSLFYTLSCRLLWYLSVFSDKVPTFQATNIRERVSALDKIRYYY